jgi:hypothetical protein
MQRSRGLGCALWLAVLIVVLVVLSILFGGFQKGARVNGAARVTATVHVGESLPHSLERCYFLPWKACGERK